MTELAAAPAQAAALGLFSRSGGGDLKIQIGAVPDALVDVWDLDAILVARGDEFVVITSRGEVADVSDLVGSAAIRAAEAEARFGFVWTGARVIAVIPPSLATDLANYDATEGARRFGREMLEAVARNEERIRCSVRVAVPPPPDQASDPDAPVGLEVPEFDQERPIFVVRQRDLARAEPVAGT